MARRPDVPCAVCGKLMWSGSTSLPPGQATCHPCRRKLTPRPPTRRFVREIRSCQKCGASFEATHPNNVYCSPRCRRSYSPGRKWLSGSERGYGAEHVAARAKFKREVVDKGLATCHFCNQWVDPKREWHYDHTVDRAGYRGATHPTCNTSDGAKRRKNRTTWADLPLVAKNCPTCGAAFETIYPRQTYCRKECRPKRTTAPKVPRRCRCGGRLDKGRRLCSDCLASSQAAQYAALKTYMRNKYRSEHGIPIDPPVRGRPIL